MVDDATSDVKVGEEGWFKEGQSVSVIFIASIRCQC